MVSEAVVEQFGDEERLLLLTLVTKAWVEIRDDEAIRHNARECEAIIAKLSGADTRLYVERAYPSRNARVRIA